MKGVGRVFRVACCYFSNRTCPLIKVAFCFSRASRCVRIMAKFKCRLNAGAVPVPLRGAPDCEYWARFEPNRLRLEDCRTTNETQMIPTSLRIFQRLLRCVVESDTSRDFPGVTRICQCSMSRRAVQHAAVKLAGVGCGHRKGFGPSSSSPG